MKLSLPLSRQHRVPRVNTLDASETWFVGGKACFSIKYHLVYFKINTVLVCGERFKSGQIV